MINPLFSHTSFTNTMVNQVFICATSGVTALGNSIEETFERISQGKTGIENNFNEIETSDDLGSVAKLSKEQLEKIQHQTHISTPLTKCELLLNNVINTVTKNDNAFFANPETLLILSSTKGDIDAIDNEETKQGLHFLVKSCQQHFNCHNIPLMISNACVSGVTAVNLATDFIKIGKYNRIVVAAVDIFSQFVFSGFMSFKALSNKACKPYDKHRTGLSLGEGASAILLNKDSYGDKIEVLAGATSNDANHISGPSRTGEGLKIAIKKAIQYANISNTDIDVISSHGTATPYNDEMESIAFSHLGFEKTPLFSIKGSIGHTLGVSGVIELALLVQSMKYEKVLPNVGFIEKGTSCSINVVKTSFHLPIKYALKTASGFGGGNAAIVLKK